MHNATKPRTLHESHDQLLLLAVLAVLHRCACVFATVVISRGHEVCDR